MKKNILLVTVLGTLLLVTGCATTGAKDDNPIVSNNFEFNDNSSFAKNVMYLAGSNKFVDSKDGANETRKVTGGSAGTILSLARLDFFGAASNSLTNSLIENEPLAKGVSLFLTIPIESATPEAQESARIKAVLRYKELLALSGVVLNEMFNERKSFQQFYADDNYCGFKDIPLTFTHRCQYFLEKGKVLRISTINGGKMAVIKFKMPFTTVLLNMPKHLTKDEYIYLPKQLGKKIVMVTSNSAVIHNNKVHSFKTGATEHDGAPLSDLDMWWIVRPSVVKSGKELQFKVDMDTLKLVPINQ